MRKKRRWILAVMLSPIVLLTMVLSAFCETQGIPAGYSDIEAAIYASQEAALAASQGALCRTCHTYLDYVGPHHYIYNDPNSLYNPYCPDPPNMQCLPCHFDYDNACQPIFGGSVANACAACHTLLSSHYGWVLELPEQCIEQIRPGECFEKPPDVMVQELISTVIDLNLQQGISNSLDAKLDNALSTLDDVNNKNDVAAINTLNAFINAVEAQRGNKITNEDADILIAAAQAIIDELQNQ